MKILVDLQACQSGSRLGGIGRYSLELTKATLRRAPQHEFFFLLNGQFHTTITEIRRELAEWAGQDRFLIFAGPGPVRACDPANQSRRKASEILREAFIREINPDVLHISSVVEGWGDDVVVSLNDAILASRTAITWYDLIPYSNPEQYLTDKDLATHYYERVTEAQKAARFLAISQFSADELVAQLGIAKTQVHNISAGVDARFQTSEEGGKEHLDTFKITKPFLLYTGSFDSRKNQAGLIRAFGLLPPEIQASRQLVIAGNGWSGVYKQLQAVASEAGVSKQSVVFTGRVSDEQLLQLYRSAELFVFPSLWEGFGLPALESMACGTPAIGSNRTSIPEVLGTEQAQFDPTDPKSIADKIQEVLESPELYTQLQKHGLRHAKSFSWEKSAEIAVAALEGLYQENLSAGRLGSINPLSSATGHRGLIESIADLACEEHLSRRDLDAIAGSIEQNECEALMARSVFQQVDSTVNSQAPCPQKIGWITPWNTRCGIASYSENLVRANPQLASVILAEQAATVSPENESGSVQVDVCWRTGGDLQTLAERVRKHQLESLLIQFNYGFFDFAELSRFINSQIDAGTAVSIVLHSTQDPPRKNKKKLEQLVPALGRCSTVLVHTRRDLARLQNLGLVENTSLIPHGVACAQESPSNLPNPQTFPKKSKRQITIASYGFFLRHKGLLELVRAFAQLPRDEIDLRLSMVNAEYPVPDSTRLIAEAKSLVQKLDISERVEFHTDYLPDLRSQALLKAADLIVFPYQQTGESSSAAVRTALACGKSLAVTPIPIFDDIQDLAFALPGCSVAAIRNGLQETISHILAKNSEYEKRQRAILAWRKRNDVRHTSRLLLPYLQSSTTPRNGEAA